MSVYLFLDPIYTFWTPKIFLWISSKVLYLWVTVVASISIKVWQLEKDNGKRAAGNLLKQMRIKNWKSSKCHILHFHNQLTIVKLNAAVRKHTNHESFDECSISNHIFKFGVGKTLLCNPAPVVRIIQRKSNSPARQRIKTSAEMCVIKRLGRGTRPPAISAGRGRMADQEGKQAEVLCCDRRNMRLPVNQPAEKAASSQTCSNHLWNRPRTSVFTVIYCFGSCLEHALGLSFTNASLNRVF